MTITPIIHITDRDFVERSALHAADYDLGPQANQYQEGSPEYLHWLNVYYARVQANSVECAS